MNQSSQINLVNDLVIELQNSMTTFLNQLSAERELLLAGNAQDLSLLTTEKENTVTQLSKIESQLAPHIEAYKSSHNSEWEKAVELMEKCRQMNAENSSLVNTRLKHTTNTLHQLHSLLNTDHSVIYTEEGNQHISSEPNRSVHA